MDWPALFTTIAILAGVFLFGFLGGWLSRGKVS